MSRTTPIFSTFLFTNLFSIKCLYFFIISSLVPYFNLFVSMFITLLTTICMFRPYIDTNNPQGMQLRRFKNRTPARFEYMYCTVFPLCHSNYDMYPFLKDAPFRLCFCFVHTIAQFSRILIFSHIYCQCFRIVPFVDGNIYKINGPLRPLNSECITSTIGSEKSQTFIILAQYFEIMTKRKRNYQFTVFLIAC